MEQQSLVKKHEQTQQINEGQENNEQVDKEQLQQQQANDDKQQEQNNNDQNSNHEDQKQHQNQDQEEKEDLQAQNDVYNEKLYNNNHFQGDSPTITLKNVNSPAISHNKSKQFTQNQYLQINEFQSPMMANSQPIVAANSIIDKLKNNKNEKENIMKLPQQDQRYKQYLQTIFQHYCKINFGLAKDNTFQSMQKHVSIMTINKFMIFANDFQLQLLIAASMPKQGKQKPNKIQIRNLLMQVFKKNSQFHKQMQFEQFLQAMNKIGQICFTQMKQQQYNQNQQTTTKMSYQMVKMLKFLEISNFKEFRQKMTKLNINFSLKFNKHLQEKKMPVNYKFKYETEQNKKVEQLARPPIPGRKNTLKKDDQNDSKKHRPHLQIAKPPLNPKMSTPHIPRMINKNKSVGQRKGGSTKILPSQFAQNQRKQRNIIPFQNSKKSGKSVQKFSQPNNSPQPVIQGYVNIHLAKKGLLSLDQNKNSLTGIRKKGQFQLNNVIEQARKQTQAKVYYDYQDSRSGRAMSNLSTSKPLSQYSREPISNQSHRNNNWQDIELQLGQNEPYPRSNKIITTSNQGQLQKSRLDPHNQLKNLIDFNESDQDEYLDQHFKKEKDHDTQMGMRVEKKISQFNYKL